MKRFCTVVFSLISSTAFAQTTTTTATSEPSTSPFIAAIATKPTPSSVPTRSAQPATRLTAQPVNVESTLARMLRTTTPGGREIQPVSDPTPVDVTTGPGSVAPHAPTLKTIREGAYLVDRLGRISRNRQTKQWEFSFDSDGSTLRDPPMLILPNQQLARLESAVTQSDHDLKFRISGTVTQYNGRNYLLIERSTIDTTEPQ